MDEKTFTNELWDRIFIECRVSHVSVDEMSEAIGKSRGYARVSKSKNVCPSAFAFLRMCDYLSVSADSFMDVYVDKSITEKLLLLYKKDSTFKTLADTLIQSL